MPRRHKSPKPVKRSVPSDTCRDKRRYQSRAEALAVIDDRRRLLVDDVKLATYRCPHCQGWHLTSTH